MRFHLADLASPGKNLAFSERGASRGWGNQIQVRDRPRREPAQPAERSIGALVGRGETSGRDSEPGSSGSSGATIRAFRI